MCIGLSRQALGLTQTRPIAVDRLVLRDDRSRIPRLLASVIVSQLYDNKRHLLVLPAVAPTAHQLLQIVAIRGRIARIRLTLIPYHTIDGVWCQRVEHGIIERSRLILHRHVTTGTVGHLDTKMELPRWTERNHVLRHGILREAVVAKGYQIGLLRNEMHGAVFVDKTYSNDVVALAKQSFRNVVATRRILIIGMTYLPAVQVGDILVEQRTQ